MSAAASATAASNGVPLLLVPVIGQLDADNPVLLLYECKLKTLDSKSKTLSNYCVYHFNSVFFAENNFISFEFECLLKKLFFSFK